MKKQMACYDHKEMPKNSYKFLSIYPWMFHSRLIYTNKLVDIKLQIIVLNTNIIQYTNKWAIEDSYHIYNSAP